MPERISVYGKVEIQNGLVLNWLRFVEGMPRPEAEIEAVRIVTAEHKGSVEKCYSIISEVRT